MTTTRQRILEIIKANEPLAVCAKIADEIDALNQELLDYRVAELIRRMSDISEDHYAASWLNELEFDLWKMVSKSGSPTYANLSGVTEDDLTALRVLSEKIGGWIHWNGDGTGFIPMAEWLEKVKAKG